MTFFLWTLFLSLPTSQLLWHLHTFFRDKGHSNQTNNEPCFIQPCHHDKAAAVSACLQSSKGKAGSGILFFENKVSDPSRAGNLQSTSMTLSSLQVQSKAAVHVALRDGKTNLLLVHMHTHGRQSDAMAYKTCRTILSETP